MATNKINGKCYVGQTVGSLRQRRNNHISAAKAYRDNCYFHNAIRKYGADNFDWIILHDDITDIDFLNRLEIYYIGYYDTFENGYNLTLGGGGMVGYTPSTKTRKKLSEAGKGRKQSTKTRKKIGKANKGKKLSTETKRKLSEAVKGKYTGKNNSHPTSILINNQHFDTRVAAAEFIGVTPALIRYRILHKTKWMDYSYAN